MGLRPTTKHENRPVPQNRSNEYKGLVPIFRAVRLPKIWITSELPVIRPKESCRLVNAGRRSAPAVLPELVHLSFSDFNLLTDCSSQIAKIGLHCMSLADHESRHESEQGVIHLTLFRDP